MKNSFNKKYFLLNYFFIFGLTILALNDHILKWEYSNYFTGKLSDFAGVFILPFLLSFFFPKFIKANIFSTAIFFVFWKSSYSEEFIRFYNQFAPIEITRVVDYSDLMALPVLLLSYLIIRNGISQKRFQLRARLIPVQFVLIITLFTLIATSPPPRFYYMASSSNVSCMYCSMNLNYSEEEILNYLSHKNLHVYHDTTLIKNDFRYSKYLRDSTFREKVTYYRIDHVILEKDTLQALQFSLVPKNAKRTKVFINGMEIDDKKLKNERFTSNDNKQVRYYKRQVKKFFRKIKQH